MTNASLEFYIVEPEEAVNLIANPSFEFDAAMTGFSQVGTGATWSRVSTYTRRGVYASSFVFTAGPGAGTRGIRTSATFSLSANQLYTWSCDLLLTSSRTAKLQIINNTGGAVLAELSVTGRGIASNKWMRKTLSYTPTGAVTVYLQIILTSYTADWRFYTDGWLFKSGYDNTYFDGDSQGWLRGMKEFGWAGTPHQSSSFRRGTCRRGGTLLRVKDYATIIRAPGLGLAEFDLAGVDLVRGGSAYQGARAQERYWGMELLFTGTDEIEMLKKIRALEAAVNPKRMIYDEQPITIIAKWVDATTGEDASDPVELNSVYVTGLPGLLDKFTGSRMMVTFKMPDPLILRQAETAAVLGNSTSFSAYALARRDRYGIWSNWGVTSITASAYVRSVIIGPDGAVYIGGWWAQINGNTNMACVAKWTEAGGWAALGTGLGNTVYKLLLGVDGKLYAFGAFSNAGGDPLADYCAVYNPATNTWSAIGGVAGADNAIRDACWGRDGKLYVVGAFANIGGVAAARVAAYDPVAGTWAALGTGLNGTAYAVCPNLAGTGVYIGGAHTTAGGSSIPYLAEWDGTAYAAVGGAPNGNVKMLKVRQGVLYAGGAFTTLGTITVNYLGAWNGSRWSTIGGGVNAQSYDIDWDPYSAIVAGNFTQAYGGTGAASSRPLVLSDKIARWTGTQWAEFEVDLPGTSTVYQARHNPSNGDLYLAFANAGTVYAQAATAVTLATYNRAWPRFVISGPGKLWSIRNQTTGKAIYFDNLTLGTGETVVVTCGPRGIDIWSNWNDGRRNMQDYILPASNRDFALQIGRNDIQAYLYGNTGATSQVNMIWQDGYETMNGSLY
ncbi:MAG TPA: hypothetical protein PLT26_14925 [Anaerolineaceae bacterium]|nr:hypothetical protein [Anaerolineaceae bacterium]